MLKSAVIGVGAMGKNHARILSDMTHAELVAVSDVDSELAQKVAERYCCRHYNNYKKLIDEEKPDLVCIVVPTKVHFEVAMYCIDKGIHILLEKPIAENLSEAEKIIAAAEERNIKLLIGHIERFNPAVRMLKKMIDDGCLGKIFKIDVNRVGPFPARIRDVGVILDLAVHDIDIARYLTGSEVTKVFAFAERQIHTTQEDLLSGLMLFEDKTICNLNINWLTPTKIRKLYITGEKGMFVVDYLRQQLTHYENAVVNKDYSYAEILGGVTEGRMIKYLVEKKEPLFLEIEHFIDCVKNSKTPLVTGRDGLLALKLAKQLVESSRKGDFV